MEPDRLLDYIMHRLASIPGSIRGSFPVDIAAVASHLEIRYHEEPLPRKIDGVYFRTSTGTAHICVNNCPGKSRGRRRYTGAHEIMHHIAAECLELHEAYYLDTTRMSQPPLERLCNLGAACLLMPEDAARRAWSEFRLYSRAEILAAMCQCFGVTRSAIRIRLTELGLLPSPGDWKSGGGG